MPSVRFLQDRNYTGFIRNFKDQDRKFMSPDDPNVRVRDMEIDKHLDKTSPVIHTVAYMDGGVARYIQIKDKKWHFERKNVFYTLWRS